MTRKARSEVSSVLVAGGGNSVRAREHLEKALQIDEANSITHYLLGRTYQAEASWPEALARFRTLDLCDDLRQHYGIAVLTDYYLAESLAQEGYLSAALDQYRRFIERAEGPWPETADARFRTEARGLLRAAFLNRSRLHERLDQPAAIQNTGFV